MTPFRKLGYLITADLAVDLGTVNTLIYSRARGIVVSEPTILANDHVQNEIIAVGTEALDLEGREPEGVKIVRPVRHGVVANLELTGIMLQHFIRKARGIRGRLSRRVLIGAPCGATEVERRAIREAIHASSVGRVYLVEEGLAAALGSGIILTGPEAHMVVDIGGGTTNIAVVGRGGIIDSGFERIGGLDLDEAITTMIREKYNLSVGPRTAERVKMELGSAVLMKSSATTKVMGRWVDPSGGPDGRTNTVTVTHQEVFEAISPVLTMISQKIQQSMWDLPPEVAGDIARSGLMLTGGTALLPRLSHRLETELKIPVKVAENPLLAVVVGMGRLFDDARLLRQIVRREDVTWWREYMATTEYE